MRWHIPLSALIMDLALFVPLYTKSKYNHTPRKTKVMIKGLCIGYAVVILLVGCVDLYTLGVMDLYSWLLLAGMAVCAIGDIVIESKFIPGGFFFGFGHFIYIVAFFMMAGGIGLPSIIAYIILAALGTYLTMVKLSKKYRAPLMAYNFVISFSFALSIPLIMSGEPGKMAVGTGAVLLVASDWLLARNKEYGSNFKWSLLALELYFGGQMLIASYPYFIKFL